VEISLDFELKEEQKSLRAIVKDFCQKEVDWKYLRELGEKKVSIEIKTMPVIEELKPAGT
jgi:hypothetical protein